jgi:ligand-binding sensor domain-containing protein
LRRKAILFFGIGFPVVLTGFLSEVDARGPVKLHPAWTSYTNTNYVAGIAVDGDNIWVAGGGVKRYNRSTGAWLLYHPEHGLASNDTRALAVTGEFVWVATAAGVSRYNKTNGEWHTYGVEDGLADYVVTSVAVDGNRKHLWFGTWDGGASQYDMVRDEWRSFRVDDGLANNRVLCVAVDAEANCVWFGTWDGGASRYETGSGQWRTFNTASGLAGNIVSSIAVDDEVIWFGTTGNGVSTYNKRTREWKNFSSKNGLAGDDVSSILVDPYRSVVWVGLRAGRVSRYETKKQKWETLNGKEGLATNDVTSIALTESEILFGTWGGGVSRFNISKDQWKKWRASNEIPHNRVVAVAVDSPHKLVWFGTEGAGAGSYDPAAGRWSTYDSKDYLACDVVNSISVDDSRGVVWFSTTEGLQSLDPATRSGLSFDGTNSPLNSIVHSGIVEDGRIWCGSFGDRLRWYDLRREEWHVAEGGYALTINSIVVDEEQGLLYLATNDGVLSYNIKKRDWEPLGSAEDVPLVEVRSILLDKKHQRIWAGSWGRGAYRYDMVTRGWRFLDTRAGLPSDYVIGLALDKDGAVWLGTEHGACRYDPDKEHLQTFTTRDGLGHNFVLAIAVGDGEVWFGTWGGGASKYTRSSY